MEPSARTSAIGDARIEHLWTHRTQDHAPMADRERLIERGEGVYVWTQDGRRLLDGFAGLAVVNVGHGRREIAEAIRDQAMRLAYYPTTRGFSNRPAVELAERLAALTPGDLRYAMFAVSGSEANERAMQIARHYWLRRGRTGKYKVVSLQAGYHGATLGTFAVCGIPDMVRAYDPLAVTGFAKVPGPARRFHAGARDDEDLLARSAQRLREAIEAEGPDTVSAVILEPVQSAGGFLIPPLGWLERVRAICDELDVLMIADEVITGFGRTGRWFGCDHDAVVPDIMSVAKGITSGYLPLSAAIVRERIADAFSRDAREENVHPNTYAAHPTACAAGLANLAIMEREGLVANAERMGARLREGLATRLAGVPVVEEVRGRGLMVCVDFVAPDGSGQPLDRAYVQGLDQACWERGAIVYARGTVCRLAPPLCITAAEVDELADIVADGVQALQDSLPGAVATTG